MNKYLLGNFEEPGTMKGWIKNTICLFGFHMPVGGMA